MKWFEYKPVQWSVLVDILCIDAIGFPIQFLFFSESHFSLCFIYTFLFTFIFFLISENYTSYTFGLVEQDCSREQI